MLRIVLTIMLYACSSCVYAEVDGCALYRETYPDRAIKLTDARMLTLVHKVAEAAGLSGEAMPIVCEGEPYGLGPSAFARRLGYPILEKRYIVLLPHEMLSYTADAATGIIAHEFGHVDAGNVGLVALSDSAVLEREKDADQRAVRWVGKHTVLTGLRVVRDKVIPQIEPVLRYSARKMMQERIKAIQNLP